MTQAMEQHQDMDHPARHGGAGTAPPQPAGRVRGRSRRVAMGVAVLALLGAAGGLTHYELRGKYVENTDDAYIQADIVTVAPKVSGYVERVDVANNQEVRAGQRLLRIDPREYAAQLAQYQAQVEAANASADNARAQLATQKARHRPGPGAIAIGRTRCAVHRLAKRSGTPRWSPRARKRATG
ncbi:putative multidrug resistance transport (partial sequence protein [Ralstonia solanacearum IPO1609]|uniref:Multidrug resistance transport (partial sequence protein) n=1 Tax=Ralstonia solanacearum IPO1609 TaxID=564066 RepID=A0ABF7RFL2_RALSL|nr:putative multidrug resistance transport (partial sequence protein [Ralstonia solanacearum IPO1609]